VAFIGAAFWGLHMALTQGLLAKLVADTAPVALRGTAFGVFNLISGGALLLASVTAGALWGHSGRRYVYRRGSLRRICGIGLLVSRPRATSVGTNPRAVRRCAVLTLVITDHWLLITGPRHPPLLTPPAGTEFLDPALHLLTAVQERRHLHSPDTGGACRHRRQPPVQVRHVVRFHAGPRVQAHQGQVAMSRSNSRRQELVIGQPLSSTDRGGSFRSDSARSRTGSSPGVAERNGLPAPASGRRRPSETSATGSPASGGAAPSAAVCPSSPPDR